MALAFLENLYENHNTLRIPKRFFANFHEFRADWVWQLRKEFNLTQEMLAVEAEVTVTCIQDWEKAKCTKGIQKHNQDKLGYIERKYWMKHHFTLIKPYTADIKAMYDLVKNRNEESARNLGLFLIDNLPSDHRNRARIFHWIGLTYSIEDPASPNILKYAQLALNSLTNGEDKKLEGGIHNDILGTQFEALKNMPKCLERLNNAKLLRNACLNLDEKYASIITSKEKSHFLWNSHEVADKYFPHVDLVHSLNYLFERLDETIVRKRVLAELEAYLRTYELLTKGYNYENTYTKN